MRPIDADELKKLILKERDAIPKEIYERYGFGVGTPNKHGNSMRGGIRIALRCMENTPTLDVVEVVRCKGCIHYNTSGCADGFGWCEKHNRGEMDEHFCSYGERKDGEQNAEEI